MYKVLVEIGKWVYCGVPVLCQTLCFELGIRFINKWSHK